MATSSSTSAFLKKKENIIDGRLFSRSVVYERIQSETEDMDNMESIVAKLKQQGLYRLGSSNPEFYDEEMVEEFYLGPSIKLRSQLDGGDVSEITATVRDVQICINQSLLETLFHLSSDGLRLEQLETFGSQEVLTTYWSLFTGNKDDVDVHTSCNKKKFSLPFLYLHDFCCRVIENRTDAFDMCTNLRYRMMVAILSGEKVNWCQVLLRRLQEEVLKPASQKKSFGLILNYILKKNGVPRSPNAKRIGSEKFIGGSKPTAFNKPGLQANKPFVRRMPKSADPRDVTKSSSEEQSHKKRKRSVSDSASPLTAAKKPRKASKSRSAVATAVTVEDPI